MYTYNDIFFSPQGYIWVGMWYTLCVVDSVIMKHVADTVPMTTWSRTFYNVRLLPPPRPPSGHLLPLLLLASARTCPRMLSHTWVRWPGSVSARHCAQFTGHSAQ
jgi:hypothetical protein